MKNSESKIGIIGFGVVGQAVHNAFSLESTKIVIIDPAKGYNNTYKDLADCEGVFVCVPSPSNSDGSCDSSILESVLEQLENFNGVIISKTTAAPSVYEKLSKKYKNLVHAPEFLTEANSLSDYRRGQFAIIGASMPVWGREAKRLISISQPYLLNINHCSVAEASIVKYTINCFLASKVIFMNEIYELCKSTGNNYYKILESIKLDPRIGESHLNVPGTDGRLGFGGMCFPKDTAAFLKYAESCNVNLDIIDAAVKKNLLLRLTSAE